MTKYDERGHWRRVLYLGLTAAAIFSVCLWVNESKPPVHQHTIDKWSDPELVSHWNRSPFYAQWAICNECGETLTKGTQ